MVAPKEYDNIMVLKLTPGGVVAGAGAGAGTGGVNQKEGLLCSWTTIAPLKEFDDVVLLRSTPSSWWCIQ
jgi:hypothetical protein